MATKNEKIKAIVNGTANELFSRDVAEGTATSSDYEVYWNGITMAELEKCFAEEGIPSTAYFSKPGPAEGSYVIESDGSWILYVQEGGTKYDEMRFKSKQEALHALLVAMAKSFGIFE